MYRNLFKFTSLPFVASRLGEFSYENSYLFSIVVEYEEEKECVPPKTDKKVDLHEIEMEKKEREQERKKKPTEQFLSPSGKNITKKNSASILSTKVKFADEDGSSGGQQAGSR